MSKYRRSTAGGLTTQAGRLVAGKALTGMPLGHDMQQLLKKLLLTISKGEKSIER